MKILPTWRSLYTSTSWTCSRKLILSNSLSLFASHHIQFWVHIKTSTIFVHRELQKESRTCSLILKPDLDAIVETWSAKTSWAILAVMGNLKPLIFHHTKILKSFCKVLSYGVFKYFSMLDLISKLFFSSKCWKNNNDWTLSRS